MQQRDRPSVGTTTDDGIRTRAIRAASGRRPRGAAELRVVRRLRVPPDAALRHETLALRVDRVETAVGTEQWPLQRMLAWHPPRQREAGEVAEKLPARHRLLDESDSRLGLVLSLLSDPRPVRDRYRDASCADPAQMRRVEWSAEEREGRIVGAVTDVVDDRERPVCGPEHPVAAVRRRRDEP